MATQLFSNNGLLVFDNSFPLATKEEYELADRCVGSVFEALSPGEHVQLQDGYFVLNDDLDLVENNQLTQEKRMSNIKAVVSEAEPRLYCENLVLEGLPGLPCQLQKAADGGWTVAKCNYYLRAKLKVKFNNWLRDLERYGVEVLTPEKQEKDRLNKLKEKAESFLEGVYIINTVPSSERVSYAWGAKGEVTVKDNAVSGKIISSGSHPNDPHYAGKTLWEGTCPLIEFWEKHCNPWNMQKI